MGENFNEIRRKLLDWKGYKINFTTSFLFGLWTLTICALSWSSLLIFNVVLNHLHQSGSLFYTYIRICLSTFTLKCLKFLYTLNLVFVLRLLLFIYILSEFCVF